LLAEQVYTDYPSGKRIIAGTFNTMALPSFPARVAQQAYAYISITDVRANGATLSLRLVDTVDLSVVMQSGTLAVTAATPQETIEAVIPVPGFFIPHEGIYDFELHADGERLGCLRLTAHGVAQQDTQEESDDNG